MNLYTLAFLTIIIAIIASLLRMWIKLHYANKKIQAEEINYESFSTILDQTHKLEERVKSLENILDRDLPGWRNKA